MLSNMTRKSFTILILVLIFPSNEIFAKKIGVKIRTNTSNTNITIDGVAAGTADRNGTDVELEAGWNNLQVSASGYLSEEFRVYIGKRGPFQIYFELKELSDTEKKKDSDSGSTFKFPNEKIKPSQLSSSCVQIQQLTKPAQRQGLSCAYVNLGAELLSTGPHISDPSSFDSPALKVVMEKFVEESLGSFSENWVVLGEQLQYMSSKTEGYEASALASLFDGDCNRVSQIYTYMKMLTRYSPAIWLFQATCHELHSQPALATAILKKASLAQDQPTNSSAAILYHKARLELASSTETAISTLQSCRTKFPWFQECFLMASDLELARENLKEYRALKNIFKVQAQKTIGPKVHNAIKAASKKSFDEALTQLNELGFYNRSFAASWLKVLIEKEKDKKPSFAALNAANMSSVLAVKAAGRVANLVEKSGDKDLTEKALKILTRDVPSNPYFLWKLSGFYLKSGNCQEVLKIVLPSFDDKPKQKAGLLEHRARCHLALKNYPGAIEDFTVMTKLIPRDWKAHYQLAEAFIKNSNKLKAISSYRESLSLDPPKNFETSIKKKLKVLGEKS